MRYNTKQKETVLKFLEENKDKHLTVDDINNCINRIIHIGQTTIYRVIDELVKDGKVKKFIVDNTKSACYQFVDNIESCNTHFHMICEKCHKLIHLDCNHISDVVNHISDEHSFKVNTSKIVLYGICEDCKDESL